MIGSHLANKTLINNENNHRIKQFLSSLEFNNGITMNYSRSDQFDCLLPVNNQNKWTIKKWVYCYLHFHHQQTGRESPPDAVKCGNLTCVNLGSEVIIVMMMIMIIQVMMMTIIMITRVMIMCTIWYDNSVEDLKSHSDSHCYCYEVDTQSFRSSNAFARVRNATQRVNCQPVVIQRFLLPLNNFLLQSLIWWTHRVNCK